METESYLMEMESYLMEMESYLMEMETRRVATEKVLNSVSPSRGLMYFCTFSHPFLPEIR